MKYNKISRRLFLQGSSGYLLTLPFLPSLIPEKAEASINTKRLISFFTRNGTLHSAWYPSQIATSLIAPNIREASLTTLEGTISEIIGQPFSGLKNKLLLVRGLDGLHDIGHNRASMLGANCGHGDGSYTSTSVTMDQILGNSPKFYSNTPRFRVLNLSGTNRNAGISYIKSGDRIVLYPYMYDPKSIFEKIFGITGGLTSQEIVKMKVQRKSIIDQVYQDYLDIYNSKKISSSDRKNLDSHLSSIRDVEKKINAISETPDQCVTIDSPKSVTTSDVFFKHDSTGEHSAYLSSLIDLIVLAIRCDLTRVVSFHVADTSASYPAAGAPSDHHGVSHTSNATGDLYAKNIDIYLGSKFAELASKLDAISDTNGNTLLDNTVLMWGHEFAGTGITNHRNEDMPILIAGGAGFLKMGRYIDYRRSGLRRSSISYSDTGVPYNQLLVTLFQGYGLTPSEYEQGKVGFGDYRDNVWKSKYDLSDTAKRSPLVGLLK